MALYCKLELSFLPLFCTYVYMSLCLAVSLFIHQSLVYLPSIGTHELLVFQLFIIHSSTSLFGCENWPRFGQREPSNLFPMSLGYVPITFSFLSPFLLSSIGVPGSPRACCALPWLSYFFKEARFFLDPSVFASSVQMSSERGKWTLHAITKIVLTS